MRNISTFNILFSLILTHLLSLTICHAKIRDFETTRLQSTSGAGVATILVNEASVLNPATIVFVPVSSFYYQNGNSKFEVPSPLRSADYSD